MSKFIVTFFIPPTPYLGITLGAIHYKKKPIVCFPPSVYKFLQGVISDFQWKCFSAFFFLCCCDQMEASPSFPESL